MTVKDNLDAIVAQLKQKLQDAQDAAKANADAVTAELGRVNDTIAALKTAQQGGSVSDADLQAAIDSLSPVADGLGAVVTNLGATTAAAAAEDPAPTPGA
jgi:excinuclease UvrABC nuclease subunit